MDSPPSLQRYDLLLRRVGDLPALPDVVNKTLQLLGNPNTPASQIANLISYDPGLTSKFLRMVNSAAYGFPRQISSVQHAIMILGFSMVRGVVLSASLFKMLEKKNPYGLDPTEFWRHSIGTAIGSRIIAGHWNIRYAEDAFSAGMLHDIGKMMLNCYIAEDYREVLTKAKLHQVAPHGMNFLEIEQEVLGFDHTDLGYHLAVRWKLPIALSAVIHYHHHPEESVSVPELVQVVALANAFSIQIQSEAATFDPSLIPVNVLNYFDYDPENPEPLLNLFNQITEEMHHVEELLSSMKR